MAAKSELLQGTLDLLILRTLGLGPQHGLGIARRSRADHARRVSGQARVPLSGAVSSRRKRLAHLRVGRLGIQASRQVLPADQVRTEATEGGNRQLAADRARDARALEATS